MADGLGSHVVGHRRRVHAQGPGVELGTVLAEPAHERVDRERRQLMSIPARLSPNVTRETESPLVKLSGSKEHVTLCRPLGTGMLRSP